MATQVQRFFNLIGLLKYGIVLSSFLIFLPFTAFKNVPGNGITGNMFVELPTFGVFVASLFLLGVGGCASKPEDLVACAKVGWRGFIEETDPFLLMCWVAAGLGLTIC